MVQSTPRKITAQFICVNIWKQRVKKDIGAHYWNYGRTEEIKERYVHLGSDDN